LNVSSTLIDIVKLSNGGNKKLKSPTIVHQTTRLLTYLPNSHTPPQVHPLTIHLSALKPKPLNSLKPLISYDNAIPGCPARSTSAPKNQWK